MKENIILFFIYIYILYRLTRTQHDIQIGAERIRSDQHLRLEDEKLSATRQAELTRLARQVGLYIYILS